MKKIYLILALLSFLFTANQSLCLPVYVDELPQSYVNNVRKQKQSDYKQALNIYNTENAKEVKVYSPERIQLRTIYQKQADGSYIYRQNYDIGDKVRFIVAEDVVKNSKVIIKKGSEVIGTIRDAQIGVGEYSAPDEIQVSFFQTKDVSNNNVNLFGTIDQDGKEIGFFNLILFKIPTFKAAIPKNKIYTLYCK